MNSSKGKLSEQYPQAGSSVSDQGGVSKDWDLYFNNSVQLTAEGSSFAGPRDLHSHSIRNYQSHAGGSPKSPLAQVGFDLSQVSLGIYTDYGASMTDYGSSIVLGEGDFQHFNEGSVVSVGNHNISNGVFTEAYSPGPGFGFGGASTELLEASSEVLSQERDEEAEDRLPYEDTATDPEHSRAAGRDVQSLDSNSRSIDHFGSITMDGTLATGITGSQVARSVEDETEDAGLGTGQQTQLSIQSPTRLKIAQSSSLEAYSTKPITHVMPNMPHDPALEAYVLGRNIGDDEAQPIPITGTIRYMPDQGYVFPNAGVYVLRALFVPDDTHNIAHAEISVEITVLKARPTVRWTEPQPMFSETPIGPLQLNATVHCPGLRDEIDGHMEYVPARGEVLPVGLHVLRCRYVPYPRSQHNYDCTNSWAEVPLLIKPKPFNKEYLDKLAPKDSAAISRKKKVKDPKDTWVAGMAWPDPKEVVLHKARRSKLGSRPSTTSATTAISATKDGMRSRTAVASITAADSEFTEQESATAEYKLADEWNISPRTKDDLHALSRNIHAAAQARELLTVHSRLARSATDTDNPYVIAPDNIDEEPRTLIIAGDGDGDTLLSSRRGDGSTTSGIVQPIYTDADYAITDTTTEKNLLSYNDHIPMALSGKDDNVPLTGVSSTADVLLDAFDRPLYRLDSDNNAPEWLSSFVGDHVAYPEDSIYHDIGKNNCFKGGIPLNGKVADIVSGQQAVLPSSANAYLLEGMNTSLYYQGSNTEIEKIFRKGPPEVPSHRPSPAIMPKNDRSVARQKGQRAQTAENISSERHPIMHFGTGNTGKQTTRTIDDMLAKAGKNVKTRPFQWNYFVDKRDFGSIDTS